MLLEKGFMAGLAKSCIDIKFFGRFKVFKREVGFWGQLYRDVESLIIQASRSLTVD
jgi:hypothetical protein